MRFEIVDGAATRELRREVLRPTWPLGSAMHGDDNPDAVHLGALDDDGQLLGTCLVLPRPYPPHPELPGAWQLRGMATTPQRRSQGIGAALLAAALAEIRQHGGHLVWCDARTTAVAFYAQNGFATEGEEFRHAESGIPHYRMWRTLAE
jgi:predicted GNAT family N-acyltransferase